MFSRLCWGWKNLRLPLDMMLCHQCRKGICRRTASMDLELQDEKRLIRQLLCHNGWVYHEWCPRSRSDLCALMGHYTSVIAPHTRCEQAARHSATVESAVCDPEKRITRPLLSNNRSVPGLRPDSSRRMRTGHNSVVMV